MNILGSIQKWGSALYHMATDAVVETEQAAEEAESPSDADGPGAGGGYEEADSVEIGPLDDGPGAGGGYFTESLSDGPGAGGGYDGDSDGPGAGGGYNTFTTSSAVTASWGDDLVGLDGFLADTPQTVTASYSGNPTLEAGQVFSVSGEWTLADETAVKSKKPQQKTGEAK